MKVRPSQNQERTLAIYFLLWIIFVEINEASTKILMYGYLLSYFQFPTI